jgi:antirestriction protein
MNNQQITEIGLQEYRKRSTGPRVYVACLAAYNNGWLHGRWIDAAQEYDDFRAEIDAMLKDSPVTKEYGEIAEEWAIHDSEGFGSYRVEEWSNLEELCEIANLIENEDNGELILELVSHLGSGTSIEDAKEFLDNNYQGTHKDVGEYAEYITEECGTEIPKHLQHYIDYDRMGRDMELNGDIFTLELNDGLHVFWNH